MRPVFAALALAFAPIHAVWGQAMGRAGELAVEASVSDALPLLALRPAPVSTERHNGAVVDWFPGTGGFRVTGGVRDTDSRGQDGAARGQLAPYIGLGWQGNLLDGRILVGLDLGAFYQGHPDVRLNQDLRLSAPAGTDDPGRSLPFHPVISLNLIYRF